MRLDGLSRRLSALLGSSRTHPASVKHGNGMRRPDGQLQEREPRRELRRQLRADGVESPLLRRSDASHVGSRQ